MIFKRISMEIREFRQEDKDNILDLRKDVWGENFAGDMRTGWDWEFRDNPYILKGSPLAWVAEDNGRIAGFASRRPVELKVYDQIIPAFWGMNLMVHPDWREKFLGVKLSRKTIKDGVFVIGWPFKEKAYLFFKGLGWMDLFSVSFMNRYFNIENVLRKKTKNELIVKIGALIWRLSRLIFDRSGDILAAGDININRIDSFDDRIDGFWKDVCKGYEFIVVRDKRYLNWRFVDAPDKRYTIYLAESGSQIRGYIVLYFSGSGRDGIRRGYIVDMLAGVNDRDAIDFLIFKAVKVFKEGGADLIHCFPSNRRFYQMALKKNGFISGLKRNRLRLMGKNIPDGVSINPMGWFITMADFNI
ncbi:GNAT family N-acetyltransferase [bacterium]|nr:GNAT family N-acetyltransferase [bacterium]